MPNKMVRFTQRARRELTLAQTVAERLEHSLIGTEHLPLGLMRAESAASDSPIMDTLAELGLERDELIRGLQNRADD